MIAAPIEVLARHLVDGGLVILIWLVQLIVYPSFRHVDAGAFREWHSAYSRRISVFVVPLMLGQAGVVGLQLAGSTRGPLIAAAVVVAVCWLATFALAVPCHRRLAGGKEPPVIERLIRVNWIRTIGWTAVFVLGFA